MGGGKAGSKEHGEGSHNPYSRLPAPCCEWRAVQLYIAVRDVQTQRVFFFNKQPLTEPTRWYISQGIGHALVFIRLQKPTAPV
jgi:hypothetical protein